MSATGMNRSMMPPLGPVALRDRPKGPPTATNRQSPPTANRHQAPTANRHQPPTANRHQPPTANRQPPPTMVEHMSYAQSFGKTAVQEHFFFLLRTPWFKS